jgi:hypothetical protein
LEKFTSPDGIEHSVDLSYEFIVDGIKYLNIVECKHWNKKVTREVVKAFKSVRDDLRAHRAIMVTNHGYQSGAVEYAQKHGIALIKLTKQEREVLHHFDGGYAGVQQALISEPQELNTGDELDLVGFFYPNDKELTEYLIKKYGVKFALFLFDDGNSEFDLDDTTGPIPDELVKVGESIANNWYEDYNLIETGGLNFRLENEGWFRVFNMKISFLKMHIQMRKNRI